MKKRLNASVIIPAFNESETIKKIVLDIKERHPDFEVIIVDDGSTDDTSKALEALNVKLYRHPYNIGNGAAIKSGIRLASGNVLILMDGDGQHRVGDIEKLMKYIPEYDMVVGARKMDGHASGGRAAANFLYNRLASYVAGVSIKDLTSGFRVLKADIAKNFISLLPNTYSYPTTLTLCLLRAGGSLKYIMIDIEKRKGGVSKIRIMRDGIKFVMIIVKICTLYAPFRIFFPISFLIFLCGSFYYLYTFLAWNRFTNMSALMFTTSILVFLMGLISEQICQMRFERIEERKFEKKDDHHCCPK